jgi:hypothetical protein
VTDPSDPSGPPPSAALSRQKLRAGVLRVGAVVVLGGLAYAVAPVEGVGRWLTVTGAFGLQVLIAPFTFRRVQRIESSDTPVLDAVLAVTVTITALVLGFSAIYLVLAERPDEVAGLETRLDSVYFTVTTLATVGTGDIHAQGQTARAVAVVQMLANVVVLAVSVRLLTGIAVRRVQDQGRLPSNRPRGPGATGGPGAPAPPPGPEG